MGEMAALPRGGVAGMVRFREEASPALGLERLPGSSRSRPPGVDGVAHPAGGPWGSSWGGQATPRGGKVWVAG